MTPRWHYRSLRAVAPRTPSRRPCCVPVQAETCRAGEAAGTETATTTPKLPAGDRARLEGLEHLFANAQAGLHIGDCDGRVLSANRALALLLGFNGPGACEGLLLTRLLVEDGVATQIMDAVRRGKTVTNVETLLRGAGDEPRRASIDVSGRFEDGELVLTRWMVRPHPGADVARRATSLLDEIDIRVAVDRMSGQEQRDRLAELQDFFEHCRVVPENPDSAAKPASPSGNPHRRT